MYVCMYTYIYIYIYIHTCAERGLRAPSVTGRASAAAGARVASIRGNDLSNTTCTTHSFFNKGNNLGKLW